MGRLKHDPCIHHFSHPHPLHLSNLHTLTHCSACHLQSSDWMYSCNPCNFTLHLSCTHLPSLITHPSHPLHTLTLFPSPDAAFNCDACGCNSHGFSYHCSHCDFDIHTTCAQNPLFVTNRYHPHLLQLTFHPPYQTEGFSCDLCQGLGSNHWLYRCATCEFDAHMDCAMGIVSSPLSRPQPQLQHHNSFPGTESHQYQQYGNAVMSPPAGQSVYLHSQSMGAMQGGYQQPAVVNNNTNVVMDAMVQGFVEGAAQQVGQSFVQGLMGDGGGGDNTISACNSSFSIGSSILSGAFGDSSSES
ncbi:protein VACUOLELESS GAMETOPHYTES-like [Mercurialis annua]|uniref:protein VACUOLELESS GAMETOPHYTES-like n=1 Tax=Mercurialis annua TaxID=3986 RepID=UPI00215E7C94|nr:protein VACUOLELESS GAMETOPHYTES-like [Mercurialis annua]